MRLKLLYGTTIIELYSEKPIVIKFQKALKLLFFSSALTLCVNNTSVYAVSFPDSGSIYREFKDNTLRKFEPPVKQAFVPDAKTSEVDDGPTVWVSGFQIFGNTQLSKDEIHSILQPFTNLQLSNQKIHQAANALSALYRTSGLFAAKVFILPQSISDGVVSLHVYEGRLDDTGVSVENSGKRVDDDVVESILNENLVPGDLLKSTNIERSILLINDLPGLSSSTVLYPGIETGSAKLKINTTDDVFVNGKIDFDNFGSYYTGENRLGITVYLNSPLKRGDLLTTRFVTSGSDSNYGYISYEIPVSGNGLNVGASIDYLDYNLKHEFKTLGSEGDAFEFRGFVKQAAIRSRHTNLYWQLDFSNLNLDDHDNAGQLADREINSLSLKLNGDHDDDLFAAGTTYYSMDLTLGDLSINGNQAYIDFDSASTKTAGSFGKLGFSVARLQHLTGKLSTYVSLSGQIANQNLDSSQKFFIGGPFSVPGYPVGEASGDDAILLHLDLRHDFYDLPWQGIMQASVFYTYGKATLYKDTFPGFQGGNPNFPNTVTLQTVGIGVDQSWQQGIVLRAVLGWQVGSNDGDAPVTGNDSDQSDKDYRAWLQGIYYF